MSNVLYYIVHHLYKLIIYSRAVSDSSAVDRLKKDYLDGGRYIIYRNNREIKMLLAEHLVSHAAQTLADHVKGTG